MAEIALTAFVTFFVTIDPVGLAPIFIALTQGADAGLRGRVARQGVLVGGAVLLVFAVLGNSVLQVIGIGLPAFRIAGGLMLLLLALEMVFERRLQRRGDTAEHARDERQAESIGVFPLGIPLIAGPAAITAVLLQSSALAGRPGARLVTILAMLAVLAIVYLSLLLAGRLERVLGPTLIIVLSRVLGILLAALAVQFVIDGVRLAIQA